MSNFSAGKTYSVKEQKEILENNGYRIYKKHGSHYIYVNDSGRKLVNCYSKNSNKGVFYKLIKQYGLQV